VLKIVKLVNKTKGNKMRTETYTRTFATFDELTPEQKELAIEENFSNAWHYEHCMGERIDTLKVFAKHLNGRLDYSISCVPDRGEFISIDHDLSRRELKEILTSLVNDVNDCPLTGVCYDEDIRDGLKKNELNYFGLQATLNDYLKSIHDEYESMLSVEYISELCEANGYEFDIDTLKLS